MANAGIIGFSSYFPSHIESCEEIQKARREQKKFIDWSTYISASIKRFGSKKYHVLYTILPSLCEINEYDIYVDDFNVSVHVVEFPVKRLIKNIYEYKDYNAIIDLIIRTSINDTIILHTQNMFSINFANELLFFFNKLKRAKKRTFIVTQQQSYPPFMYYREAIGFVKGIFPGLVGELIFRKQHKYIDGYIVMNKRTYHYLLNNIGLDPNKVIYQHDGVDYEKVNPNKFNRNNRQLIDKRECDYKLALVAHVTSGFGGYTKGVDLLPDIINGLRRLGYRVCMTVIGEILDNELAEKLRKSGIILTGYLTHEETLRVIASSDLYILPARKKRYYGGITVAVIEAMALNVPVVSPTLEHVPDESVIKYLGVKTEWVTRNNLDKFIDAIAHALDNIDMFRPRDYSRRFYDIRVMVRNIEKLYDNILSKS